MEILQIGEIAIKGCFVGSPVGLSVQAHENVRDECVLACLRACFDFEPPLQILELGDVVKIISVDYFT